MKIAIFHNFLDNIGFIIPPKEDNTNMKLFDSIKNFTAAPVSQPQLSIFGENGGKSKKQILYICGTSLSITSHGGVVVTVKSLPINRVG